MKLSLVYSMYSMDKKDCKHRTDSPRKGHGRPSPPGLCWHDGRGTLTGPPRSLHQAAPPFPNSPYAFPTIRPDHSTQSPHSCCGSLYMPVSVQLVSTTASALLRTRCRRLPPPPHHLDLFPSTVRHTYTVTQVVRHLRSFRTRSPVVFTRPEGLQTESSSFL